VTLLLAPALVPLAVEAHQNPVTEGTS